MTTSILPYQQPLFDYDTEVADPGERSWLKQATQEIMMYCRRTLADHIRIGQILSEIQRRCARQFKRYIAAELPISRSTCYSLMDVAQRFGGMVEANLSAGRTDKIETKALYILSQPRVPVDARTMALTQAGAGECVTVEDAMKFLKLCKKRTPIQLVLFEHEERMKPIREQECREAPPSAEPDSRDARAWRKFKEFLADLNTTMVRVDMLDDAEEDDRQYTFSAFFANGRPRHSGGRTCPEDALESLLGREEKKRCGSCYNKFLGEGFLPEQAEEKATHPLSWFTANRTKKDGVAAECKSCSRPRIREAKNRVKSDRPAAEAAVAALGDVDDGLVCNSPHVLQEAA